MLRGFRALGSAFSVEGLGFRALGDRVRADGGLDILDVDQAVAPHGKVRDLEPLALQHAARVQHALVLDLHTATHTASSLIAHDTGIFSRTLARQDRKE